VDRLLSLVQLAGKQDQIEVRAPFTGELIARIPQCGAADVDLAVARAWEAQPLWAALSFSERRRVLLRFHDLLLERQAELLDWIQLETGKARRHAFEEILDTAVVARYYANRAEAILRPRRRWGALPVITATREYRSPVGVVGFLSPWNFALTLAITDAIPALMAGNAVIIKPDHLATLTALAAVGLLREAGLPPDVLQVVTGDGAVVGPLVAARVDALMYTGSTRTGRLVARDAASRLIPYSLELGGKNPMLVLEDADLDRTVEGAIRACFVGAGQVCISIERIYVHESLFARFVERFAQQTRTLRLGPGFDFSIEMGSLTSERQLRTVAEHVRDAVSKGARLEAGGRARPDLGPYFYEPTILTGVQPGMTCYEEETFGPVVAVYPFRTEDDAVDRANATRYGLNASVWTRDTRRGVQLARRIRAGSVNVNEGYAAAWGSVDSSIGGMKESGIGRRHGAEGILKFTEAQTVAVERLIPIAPFGGIGAELWARWMTRLVALMRRVPLRW
jgi:acyl-CoA reductase-like NAD-dependent aldehyde dehydrogenase